MKKDLRGALLLFAVIAVATRLRAESPNRAEPIEPGGFPLRVHVIEDYETEIEQRWWLRGTIVTDLLPPSLSASVPNRRACRAAPSKNFDQRMGDQSVPWRAVVFNPVPGPPMGPRTRLSFRCRLEGARSLRVQIYSLTNNYHRFLTLDNLPAGSWQQLCVDLTTARRPDGSGGPLAEDERIDDIQFYVPPTADLLIDDILLFEAAPDGETRPFPRRAIFTAWFDTGEQGKEWPGEFEIVPHQKPRTWDAAKSVPTATGSPILRVNLRGPRILGPKAGLRFRYKLTGAEGPLRIALTDASGAALGSRTLAEPTHAEWSEGSVAFDLPAPGSADNILFTPPSGADLLVDDLLLFEPGPVPLPP